MSVISWSGHQYYTDELPSILLENTILLPPRYLTGAFTLDSLATVSGSAEIVAVVHGAFTLDALSVTGTALTSLTIIGAFNLGNLSVLGEVHFSLFPGTPAWYAAAAHDATLAGISGHAEPIVTITMVNFNRIFSSKNIDGLNVELLLKDFTNGGVGDITVEVDENTFKIRNSGSTFTLVNLNDILSTFTTSILNSIVEIRLGFEGLSYGDYLLLATLAVDRYQATYNGLQIQCIDITQKEERNLSIPIGQQYFPGAPQTSRSQNIPIALGVLVDVPTIQVSGDASGTLAFDILSGDTTIDIVEFGAPFPASGTFTLGTEINIVYTTRSLINLLGRTYLRFTGLTRPGAISHSRNEIVTLTHVAYTYLIGYGISVVNQVRDLGLIQGVLAVAFSDVAIQLDIVGDGVAFPLTGTLDVGTEIGILYTTKTNVIVSGQHRVRFTGLTRSLPISHASGVHVRLTNATAAIVDPSEYVVSTLVIGDQTVTILTFTAQRGVVTADINAPNIETSNIILNGDFETGDSTHWTNGTDGILTVGSSTPSAYKGSYRGAMLGQLNAYGEVYQDVTVLDGESYDYQFFYRNEKVISLVTNYSFESGLVGWTISKQINATVAAVESTHAADGTHLCRILYEFHASLLDNYQFQDRTGLGSNNDLLYNGDVETGDFTAWLGGIPTQVIVTNGGGGAYQGTYFIQLHGAPVGELGTNLGVAQFASKYQTRLVSPYVPYRYTFAYRNAIGADISNGYASFFISDENTTYLGDFPSIQTSWTLHSGTSQSASTIMNVTVATQAVFDIIINGSFESALTQWVIDSNTGRIGAEHTGPNSVAYRDQGGSAGTVPIGSNACTARVLQQYTTPYDTTYTIIIHQDIPTVVGVAYTLSFYYISADGSYDIPAVPITLNVNSDVSYKIGTTSDDDAFIILTALPRTVHYNVGLTTISSGPGIGTLVPGFTHYTAPSFIATETTTRLTFQFDGNADHYMSLPYRTEPPPLAAQLDGVLLGGLVCDFDDVHVYQDIEDWTVINNIDAFVGLSAPLVDLESSLNPAVPKICMVCSRGGIGLHQTIWPLIDRVGSYSAQIYQDIPTVVGQSYSIQFEYITILLHQESVYTGGSTTSTASSNLGYAIGTPSDFEECLSTTYLGQSHSVYGADFMRTNVISFIATETTTRVTFLFLGETNDIFRIGQGTYLACGAIQLRNVILQITDADVPLDPTLHSFSVEMYQDVTVVSGEPYTFSYAYVTGNSTINAANVVRTSNIKYAVGTPSSPELYQVFTSVGQLYHQFNNVIVSTAFDLVLGRIAPLILTASGTTVRVTFRMTGQAKYLLPSTTTLDAIYQPFIIELDDIELTHGSVANQSLGRVLIGTPAIPALYRTITLPVIFNWAEIHGVITPNDVDLRITLQSQYSVSGDTHAVFFDDITLHSVYSYSHQVGGENPIDAILYMLHTFAPLTPVNLAAFRQARLQFSAWKFGAFYTDPGLSTDFYQQMALQCKSILFKDPSGRYTITVLDDSRALVAAYTPLNILERDVVTREAAPNDTLYTSVYVYFATKTGGSTSSSDFAGVTFATPTETTFPSGDVLVAKCAAALTLSGKERRLDFFASWIQDFGSACLLLEWLVERHTTLVETIAFSTFIDAAPIPIGALVQFAHPLNSTIQTRLDQVKVQIFPEQMKTVIKARVAGLLPPPSPVALDIDITINKNETATIYIFGYVTVDVSVAPDLTSIDLDQGAAGGQHIYTVPNGVFTATDDGYAIFVPTLSMYGTFTCNYTVRDTFGTESNVATITIDVLNVIGSGITSHMTNGGLTHTSTVQTSNVARATHLTHLSGIDESLPKDPIGS